MANLGSIASALNSLSRGVTSSSSERVELESFLEEFFVGPNNEDSEDDSGKCIGNNNNIQQQ